MAGNQPAWQYAEEDKVVSYMNCPSMFIPVTVMHFWDVYKGYTKQRAALPALRDQPRKYLEACDIYEYWFAHFQIEKAKDDERKARIQSLSRF